MVKKGKYMYINKERLKHFAYAIAIPLSASDAVKWPIRAGRAIKPVKKEFALEYAEQLKYGLERYGDKLWKMAFQNPTQIWRVSHHLINGWQEAGISRIDIAEKISLLLQGIDILSNGNPFVPLGEHKMYVSNSFENKKYENDINIMRLGGLLWAYCETIYFVAREVGCEYHGPYIVDKGNILLERNYNNLSPKGLWPQINLFHNIKKITIQTIHDKEFSVSFDVYNNLLINQGSFSDSFLEGCVLVDDRYITIDETKALIESVAKELEGLCEYIDKMEENYLLWQYVRIFWYRKKGLADVLDVSWEPNEILKTKFHNTNNIKKKKATERVSKEVLIQKYDYSEELYK